MLLNLCMSFYPFLIMNNLFDNYFNKKKSRNLVAAIHALASVVFNGIYFLTDSSIIGTFSHNLSLGYFAFDIYYILLFEKLNILRLLYIYHHFASIYMIFNSYLIYNSHTLLFFGELSNIPSYIVYHYMHNENRDISTQFIIKMFKKIQKVIYGLVRIPILTCVLINMLYTLDFNNIQLVKVVSIISPVYVMGLVWTFKLLFDK